MKRKFAALALAALLSLPLTACGEQNDGTSRPAPDLTGEWKQVGEASNFYQIATITEDHMELYWFVVEDSSTELYWTGSFTPPENGKEPYTWTSVTDLEDAYHKPWALRDETKTFTYKGGKISYTVNMGNLRMGVALEKQ